MSLRQTKQVRREQLLDTLHRLYYKAQNGGADTEDAHIEADTALLRYIDDEEITRAYDRIEPKWYA